MSCQSCKKKKQEQVPQTVDQMIALEMNDWNGGVNRFHTHFENAEFIDPILIDKIEQDEQGE